MSQVCVYVKASGNCIVYDRNITIGDVLKVECTNVAMLREIKQMELYRFNHPHAIVFSILKVIERIHESYPNADIVNVVPQPKAGGSMATQAYANFEDPVVVEEIKADAGIDIGFTLIGMHLKKVAVPVRLENNKIGEATVLAARTRPRFIGGSRAVYNEELL